MIINIYLIEESFRRMSSIFESLDVSLVFDKILFLVVRDSNFKSPEVSMPLLFPVTISNTFLQ